MEIPTAQNIESILIRQRSFFGGHSTLSVAFRIQQLKRLKSAILRNEQKIKDALWTDLHKSPEEAYLTEISIVLQEIGNHLKNLKRWAKPKRVSTPIQLLPSSSKIVFEPLGIALIMAPWNYPFQLLFNPLVGAISSGCCAVLKPSPYTPHVADVMQAIAEECFDPSYISMVQGGREVNKMLLEQRYDLIFFTGSPALGKIVMEAAAKFLTPVVLELGGKSPCIVTEGANIELAAKRIAWGKSINAGQTCIAPDYLLIHNSVKEQFITAYAASIQEMYGKDLKTSRYYPRIVNDAAFSRLQKLMVDGKIRLGGEVDKAERFIAPTLMDEVQPDFPIMQEEIFGPLLPVIAFDRLEWAIDFVNGNEKPLALYLFGSKSVVSKVLSLTTSGGSCLNDTLIHIANHHLPFGGVGNSGISNYHGKYSFEAFSHSRAVVSSPTWIDLPFKYPPFRYFGLIKNII